MPAKTYDKGYTRQITALLGVLNGRASATVDLNGIAKIAGVPVVTMQKLPTRLSAMGLMHAVHVRDRAGVYNLSAIKSWNEKEWREALQQYARIHENVKVTPIVRVGEQIKVLEESIAPKTNGHVDIEDRADIYINFLQGLNNALTFVLTERRLAKQVDPDAAQAKKALAWMREHNMMDMLK